MENFTFTFTLVVQKSVYALRQEAVIYNSAIYKFHFNTVVWTAAERTR
jgi:hypothetical protein